MSKIKIKPSLKRKNSEWEIIPDDIPMAQDGRITLDEFRPKFTNSNQDITNNLKLKAQINSKGTQANPVNLPEVEISTVRDKPLGFAGQSLKSQQTNPYNVPASQVASQIFNFVPEAMHTPSRLVNYGIGAYKNKDLTFNPYQSEITETLGLQTDPNSLLHSIRNFAVDNAADFLVPVEGLVGFRNKSFTNPFKKSFKSEIDWGKWNKEIPGNKALMQEYHTIEQQAKANDTWMKNPDGSPFKGTPEQFVQQNSSNFKKAFGDTQIKDKNGNPLIMYHGSKQDFTEFLPPSITKKSSTGYKGNYTSFHPNLQTAEEYAGFYRGKNYGAKDNSLVKSVYINSKKPLYSKEGTGAIDDPIHAGKDFSKIYDLSQYDAVTNMKLGKDYDFDELLKKHSYDDDIIFEKEISVPYGNNVKSAVGNNGMFDMTNPNIYKSILPIGLGLGAASQIDQKKQGGNIKTDSQGYWNPKNHGKPVRIPSNKITMKGVNQPLYGIDDTGFAQMMYPGQDYQFPGSSVVELPLMQDGGKIEKWKKEMQDKGIPQELRNNAYVKEKSERAFRNIIPQSYGDLSTNLDRYNRYKKDLGRNKESLLWYAKGDSDEGKIINENIYYKLPKRDDAFSLYLGLPQKNNSFGVSDYKPSKSSEDKVYLKPNYWTEGMKQSAIDRYFLLGDKDKVVTNERVGVFNFKLDSLKNAKVPWSNPESAEWLLDNPLGDFTMSKGKDEKGNYISLYDIWDLQPFSQGEGASSNKDGNSLIGYLKKFGKNVNEDTEISSIFGAGKPFEIYDRIYYDPQTKKVTQPKNTDILKKVDVSGNPKFINIQSPDIFKNGGSIPKMQQGGNVRPPIKGTKEQYQAYQDSLDLHNYSNQSFNKLLDSNTYKDWESYYDNNTNEKNKEHSVNAYIRLLNKNGVEPTPIKRLKKNFSSNQEGSANLFQKPVQPIIYQPEENRGMSQQEAIEYEKTHPNVQWDIQHGGYKPIFQRPKEQPINIQSVKPDLLPLPDINMFNPIPFEKGTYFSRKRQSQEQSAKGKKDYFDKKTGKLLGTYKNGGKVKNSDWEIIN